MADYQTIQGENYRLLTSNMLIQYFIINPFDLNGNLIPQITIEVDSTIAPANIYLPTFLGTMDEEPSYISTNGETNFTIKIIKINSSDDSNLVNVNCAPFMRFSGYFAKVINLRSLKDSLELTPIGLATLNTYQPFLCYAPFS